MAKVSIRDRVMKAEHKQRFLDWFVRSRFYESFTADEVLVPFGLLFGSSRADLRIRAPTP